MVQVHGTDTLCGKERGDNLSFYIQASNPKSRCEAEYNNETLADAIESTFLLNTENAILMWNYISIPLSYKYDISYMIDDILMLLTALKNGEKGELTIHWLPDTFRCDWTIKWNDEQLNIQSRWENTVGHLEKLLNDAPNISIQKDDFIREWKSVLGIVVIGLKKCGYDEEEIKNMKKLIDQYESIEGNGILYKE